MKSDTRYSNRKPGVKTERPVRDMARPAHAKRTESAAEPSAAGPAAQSAWKPRMARFIPAAKDNARGALFGDTVLAERIGRDRVVVAKVVTHAHESIMGVLRVHDGVRVIQPLEPVVCLLKLPLQICTPRQKTAKLSARMLPAGKMKAAYVSASKIESAVLSRQPARLMRW